MIAIQFQKRDFEYDVYNVVKSFYPEEEIVLSDDDSPAAEYDEKISLFYGKNKISIRIERVSGDRKRQEEGVWLTEEMHGRKERKNQTKILLYHMLQKRTGQELPWGTLTGVRPTKIPMALIDAGHSNVETAKIMREQYLVSREKTALAVSIANRERHILEDIDYKNGYSLYIGIPFCPTICAYCSFSSSPLKVWKNKVDDYLDALCHEIRETASMWAGQVLDTIYIGGGTPTTLEPHQLERLLSEVEKCFDISHIKEYTVEAGRPDSITWEKLAVIRKHPVTRISINPQTMKQATLDLIGRRHTVEDVKEKFLLARTRRLAPQHLINIGLVFACHCLTSPAPLLERALKAQHLRLCLAGVLVARLTEHHPRRLEPQLRLHGRVGCHLGQLLEDARLFALKVHHVPRSRYEST